MFPKYIKLHIPKCICAEDRPRFCSIFDCLKSASDDDCAAIVQEEFPICKFSDYKPTGSNVVFLNNTMTMINSLYPPIDVVGVHTVLCHTHLSMCKSNKKIRMHTNTLYTAAYHNEACIVIATQDSILTQINGSTYRKHFCAPHARTCYSLQGMTVGTSLNVFDTKYHMVDKRWLITALSRCTTLDIHVWDNPIVPPSNVASRINGYKQQDTNSNRLWHEPSYITPNWIINRLAGSCICGGDLTDWTVDRIDNRLAHTVDNCQILCRHCNCSKK